MQLVYSNPEIRAELATNDENMRTIAGDVSGIIDDIQKNGISEERARGYVEDNVIDLLCEFISGGLINKSVKEISTTGEYRSAAGIKEAPGKETSFTLNKQFSINIGEIYPYIDICVQACSVELKKIRLEFKLSGDVQIKNPRFTVSNGKIVRVSLGTVTPSLSLFYVWKEKTKKIHTFSKPITFREIEFGGFDVDRSLGAGTMSPAAS